MARSYWIGLATILVAGGHQGSLAFLSSLPAWGGNRPRFTRIDPTTGLNTHRCHYHSTAVFQSPTSMIDSTDDEGGERPSSSFLPSGTPSTSCTTGGSQLDEQVWKLKQEASRIRLEAEKMDWLLTIRKMDALQQKLDNPNIRKLDQSALQDQFQQLQTKLNQTTETRNVSGDATVAASTMMSTANVRPTTVGTTITPSPTSAQTASLTEADIELIRARYKDTPREESPIQGFDPDDLEVYVPICWELEQSLPPNATATAKMEAFRAEPRLQTYFSHKIAALLVQPIQDLQRVEDLRSQYLQSTSTKEKEELKRQIDKLETSVTKDGPVAYSDRVWQRIQPLTIQQLRERVEAIEALPPILQAVYKSRNRLDPDSGDLELAIELDYYDKQLQVLEQVPEVFQKCSREQREDIRSAVESLPRSVRRHFAVAELQLNLTANDEEDCYVKLIVDRLCSKDEQGSVPLASRKESAWAQFRDAGLTVSVEAPEYSDIEFVDRSRYVSELYPALARMEPVYPTDDMMRQIMTECLDRKLFMPSGKPERVVGGYYIRGQNMIRGDTSGMKFAQLLHERIETSTLKNRIEFFYIPDPAPISDENFELGLRNEPVLFVTTKNDSLFYDNAGAFTKVLVSILGVTSILIYSLGSCEIQPLLAEKVQAEMQSSNPNLIWLTQTLSQVVLSMVAVQLFHELGHRIISWKDKFDMGMPSIIPSLQLGFQGVITPLKSPPPSIRSLFDFAVAGPTLGLISSLTFLVTGLTITSALDGGQVSTLPGLPTELLRSSALAGGIIEFFLGKGILSQGIMSGTVLPLHPFAVSGFVGLLVNSLALLPLGNTDGGRVALAMFGRRGAFLVKSFSAILLCLMGLLGGFDSQGIVLSYVLFSLIWQRELEIPARNEVEELDTVRGFYAIFLSLTVTLTILPL